MITGSSAVNILRNSLNLMDKRLVDHGDRVAYILYHMLKCDNSYSKDDLDRFLIIGLLHDIGAYATDEIDDMLTFDVKGVWSHSVYGHLYLRYLSPLERYADIILYHHLDYCRFDRIDYSHKEIAMYLNIADRADIQLLQNGTLSKGAFERARGKRFSPKGLDLLYDAEATFHLSQKLSDYSYKKELDPLISNITLSEEDCKHYIRLLVYAIDFRNEATVYRTINTCIIAGGICKKFNVSRKEEDLLYYASMLYDIGMLSVPENIINGSQQLTPQERSLINNHVFSTRQLLLELVPDEILNIALCHHERLNGSGYPRQLTKSDFTLLQEILQVADVIGALMVSNNRRGVQSNSEIETCLADEVAADRLSSEVVNVFLQHKEEIIARSTEIRTKTLENYNAIKSQFSSIIGRFNKYNC